MKTGYIEMENGSRIEFELYPNEAPNTVANFENLANTGFYDGVIFHRVIPALSAKAEIRLGQAWAEAEKRSNVKQKAIRISTKPVLYQWRMPVKTRVQANSSSYMSRSRI